MCTPFASAQMHKLQQTRVRQQVLVAQFESLRQVHTGPCAGEFEGNTKEGFWEDMSLLPYGPAYDRKLPMSQVFWAYSLEATISIFGLCSRAIRLVAEGCR